MLEKHAIVPIVDAGVHVWIWPSHRPASLSHGCMCGRSRDGSGCKVCARVQTPSPMAATSKLAPILTHMCFTPVWGQPPWCTESDRRSAQAAEGDTMGGVIVSGFPSQAHSCVPSSPRSLLDVNTSSTLPLLDVNSSEAMWPKTCMILWQAQLCHYDCRLSSKRRPPSRTSWPRVRSGLATTMRWQPSLPRKSVSCGRRCQVGARRTRQARQSRCWLWVSSLPYKVAMLHIPHTASCCFVSRAECGCSGREATLRGFLTPLVSHAPPLSIPAVVPAQQLAQMFLLPKTTGTSPSW